jgi:hypothetical protein
MPPTVSAVYPGHPGMGTALSLHDPKLTELRKWRINGFEARTALCFHDKYFGGFKLQRRGTCA